MNKQYKGKLLSIPNFVNTIKLVNWYEPLKSFKNIQNNIKVKLKRYFGKVSRMCIIPTCKFFPDNTLSTSYIEATICIFFSH